MKENLNHLKIRDADGDDLLIPDYSMSSGDTNVYFRDLETKIINHINEADVVLGAVAWLTSVPILDALAEKYVSIVVQKEDFLRPDVNFDSKESFKALLKRKYDILNQRRLSRFSFLNVVSNLSTCGDSDIDAVRCLGNINLEKSPAFPRMHNKFLVFANLKNDSKHFYYQTIEPYAVWTGSFNLTKNAGQSLENAVYIKNNDVAEAYANEFGNILALSEPLNWFRDWVAPEWRIGT